MERFNVGVAVQMGDPTFDPGSVHTVTIVITNLTAAEWVIDIGLATGGAGPGAVFPLSQFWAGQILRAGGSVTVSAPITMFDTPGTYPTSLFVQERVTPEEVSLTFTFDDVIITTPAFEVGVTLGWA